MGRKDYNEALITVVKLSGVLQAFSGPARAPQVSAVQLRRLGFCDVLISRRSLTD